MTSCLHVNRQHSSMPCIRVKPRHVASLTIPVRNTKVFPSHICGADIEQHEYTGVFTYAIQICEPVGGANTIGLGNLSSCAVSFYVSLVSEQSADHNKQPGLAIATTESGCSTTNWTCICTSSAYTIITAEYEDQYCSPADRHGIVLVFNKQSSVVD